MQTGVENHQFRVQLEERLEELFESIVGLESGWSDDFRCAMMVLLIIFEVMLGDEF